MRVWGITIIVLLVALIAGAGGYYLGVTLQKARADLDTRVRSEPSDAVPDSPGIYATRIVWRLTGGQRKNPRTSIDEAHYVWRVDLKQAPGLDEATGWHGAIRVNFLDSANLLVHASPTVMLIFPVSDSGFEESVDGQGYMPLSAARLVKRATWSGQYSACGVGNPCPRSQP